MEAGTRLGTYEIVEPIGSGGMGSVYRARDTKLGRQVAIKVLSGDLAENPKFLARFEREAKVLASINHANIATIFGFEDAARPPYLILELIEGQTLAQRLLQGELGVADALHVAIQVARALEAAHGNDVVHRDLKPSNIMLCPNGSVKVLDFGIAKAFADTPREGTRSDTRAADLTEQVHLSAQRPT